MLIYPFDCKERSFFNYISSFQDYKVNSITEEVFKDLFFGDLVRISVLLETEKIEYSQIYEGTVVGIVRDKKNFILTLSHRQNVSFLKGFFLNETKTLIVSSSSILWLENQKVKRFLIKLLCFFLKLLRLLAIFLCCKEPLM